MFQGDECSGGWVSRGMGVPVTLSGHQLGKASDVWWIISTHEGSFVFIIHPTLKYPVITAL